MLSGKQSHWWWWDDSPTKGTCPKAWQLEFDPQDPHSERRPESSTFHTPRNAHTEKKKRYMKTTATKPSTSSGAEVLAVECHCPLHRRRAASGTSVWWSPQSGKAWVISVGCVHFFIVPLRQFVCVHFVVIPRWRGNSVDSHLNHSVARSHNKKLQQSQHIKSIPGTIYLVITQCK